MRAVLLSADPSGFRGTIEPMKRLIQNILFALPAAAAPAALAAVLLDRSEEKNALIFGLSPFRLGMACAVLILFIFSVLIFLNRRKRMPFLSWLSGFSGLLAAEILLFSRFPCDDSRNLIPLIADRAKPLLLWLLFSAVCWLCALRLSGEKRPAGYDLFLPVSSILIYMGISLYMERILWNVSLPGNAVFCLMTIAALCLWYLTLKTDPDLPLKAAAGCLLFAVLGFSVTRITGMWMGRINAPPDKVYWNELAESFLHGRLDLMHPAGHHDLTLYNGKWYVPNPPLPGILMIPWVALLGSAEAVNMCIADAVIAGINAGLFFLMLTLAFEKDGGPFTRFSHGSSTAVSCWVTLLFVFGTDHLWLGTTGQMWFVSQMLVVSFTLLACICVICRFPPFIAGTALGMGMLCRPNIFPIFLCMLGIWLRQQDDFPYIHWKKAFVWCLKCGIPVVISAALLLLYNKLRFDDWMDFGYVTINGADWILDAVREYGMFHPHFIGINARVMLWGLPELDFSGERFFFQPHPAGYSMFLATPPLIWAFRSFRKNWASIGSWAAVLLSVGMLLMYHNTGAEQIGYRYMLDFSAPLALLTADGLRGKVSGWFKLLTVFAVVLSFVGIWWWYLGRV